MTRHDTLHKLIEFSTSTDQLAAELKKYPWDFEGKPVVLDWSHIHYACFRRTKGDVTDKELEDWANLIECREDISCTQDVADAIHQLANPLLMKESVTEIVSNLSRAHVGTVADVFKTQVGLIVAVQSDMGFWPTIFQGSRVLFSKRGELQVEGVDVQLEKKTLTLCFNQTTEPPEIGETVHLVYKDNQMANYIGMQKIAETDASVTYRLEKTEAL